MKKLTMTAVALATLATVFSCSKYDDSALLSEIKNLKDKISELENNNTTPTDPEQLSLEISDKTICMANNAESFRNREYEVPFTVLGAEGEVTVTVSWNDIKEQEGYRGGYNQIYENYGNSAEIVMETATSGKLIVIQDASKYIFSDGEYFVQYLASDINVTVNDEAGRSCTRKIHLGYERVWADSVYPCDDYTFEFIEGRPTVTIPSGAPAVDEMMEFYFSFEGADFEADGSVLKSDLNSFFYGETYSPGSISKKLSTTIEKTGTGFVVKLPIQFPANSSGKDIDRYFNLCKYERFTSNGNTAGCLWSLKYVQKK